MDIQRQEKFGEKDCFVKLDITKLNYRYKSHRGRIVLNKSDALCIIEVKNNIVKAFAVITNKQKKILTYI
ncbi:hypothetical protein H312_01064 [Anncaliia algerae PRA339]|uniref:Uncharacterized protein n=1 Tax=Anncaliia algerae PRA339 TaxID=1288291 RepID=A0A059F3E8_9MICR|nr:hypothetical protein H312_01064 [Anncaliia algerae PRA339]